MNQNDQDLWAALRDRGHTIGSAHVDDEGVLWVVVDGTPLSVWEARKLLEFYTDPQASTKRGDGTSG